jgi:hypothetical protein
VTWKENALWGVLAVERIKSYRNKSRRHFDFKNAPAVKEKTFIYINKERYS